MEFKDILKDLRKKKNISQQELADSIYVSRSAVAKWENGLGLPNEESIEALMNYFNVDRDYFFPKLEQEEVIVKNIKLRRRKIILEVCYALFVVLIFIVGVGFLSGKVCIIHCEFEPYVDRKMTTPGYYVKVYEQDVYNYVDAEDGLTKTCISGSNWADDFMNGTLNWRTLEASGVYIYKRYGLIYSNKTVDTKYIYFCLSESDSNDHINGGHLIYYKDNSNMYHYYFSRLGIYSHKECVDIWETEHISIEVNGVMQDLKYDYYFTYPGDLSSDNYQVTICGHQMKREAI